MKCQKCKKEIRWKSKCPYCGSWIEGNEKRPDFSSNTFGYQAGEFKGNVNTAIGMGTPPVKPKKTPLCYIKENGKT